MIRFLLAYLLLIPVVYAERPSICLVMITHNAQETLQAALESVKPFIDSWIILDWQSTDETALICHQCLNDIPGEFIVYPHGYLNDALNALMQKGIQNYDYILAWEAGDVLVDGKELLNPTADAYFFKVYSSKGMQYETRLVKSNKQWKWLGASCPELFSPYARNYCIAPHSSIRRKIPYPLPKMHPYAYKQLQAFKQSWLDNPLDASVHFILGTLYKDAGMAIDAYVHFSACLHNNPSSPQRLQAVYHIATIEEQLGFSREQINHSYLEAAEQNPFPYDPLYRLASYLRKEGDYWNAFQIATFALSYPPPPSNFPSMIPWSSDWPSNTGLLFEYALDTYYLGNIEEGYASAELLLKTPNINPDIKDIAENLVRGYNTTRYVFKTTEVP